jgi:lipase chaperone LimK
MNKRYAVYSLGAVLVTALALMVNNTSTISKIENTKVITTNTEIDSVFTGRETALQKSSSSSLPSSLKGTHHGVTLRSHNQNYIVTASLKDLFDYYLSAAGEDSLEKIELRVLAELRRQLSGDALAQVSEIWQNYLSYKKQLVTFDQQFPAAVPNRSDDNSAEAGTLIQLQFLQQRQLALLALQDQILGADVAGILFAFDRQLDQLTLEKAALLASDLSAEHKKQGLINLQAQLPLDSLQGLKRNQQQQALITIDDNHELTAQQKFQQRAEQVGEGAASRLQKLDEERNRWSVRILNFKQQQASLRNSGLASEEYMGSVEKLYTQHFTPEEQLRARALTSYDE